MACFNTLHPMLQSILGLSTHCQNFSSFSLTGLPRLSHTPAPPVMGKQHQIHEFITLIWVASKVIAKTRILMKEVDFVGDSRKHREEVKQERENMPINRV